jgi:hypothetical protein
VSVDGPGIHPSYRTVLAVLDFETNAGGKRPEEDQSRLTEPVCPLSRVSTGLWVDASIVRALRLRISTRAPSAISVWLASQRNPVHVAPVPAALRVRVLELLVQTEMV